MTTVQPKTIHKLIQCMRRYIFNIFKTKIYLHRQIEQNIQPNLPCFWHCTYQENYLENSLQLKKTHMYEDHTQITIYIYPKKAHCITNLFCLISQCASFFHHCIVYLVSSIFGVVCVLRLMNYNFFTFVLMFLPDPLLTVSLLFWVYAFLTAQTFKWQNSKNIQLT